MGVALILFNWVLYCVNIHPFYAFGSLESCYPIWLLLHIVFILRELSHISWMLSTELFDALSVLSFFVLIRVGVQILLSERTIGNIRERKSHMIFQDAFINGSSHLLDPLLYIIFTSLQFFVGREARSEYLWVVLWHLVDFF